MTKDTSLEELVLGYCRHAGGLVEPPAYGIYETLLPAEVAARWGLVSHQHFTFDAEAQKEQAGLTFLHYGHTLVDTIVNELRWQSANGQFFINNVRPEKPSLYAAIEKAISLPNAKLFPVPSAMEQARLHHYARFNFKVSLIADEKRELIPAGVDGCTEGMLRQRGGYRANGDSRRGERKPPSPICRAVLERGAAPCPENACCPAGARLSGCAARTGRNSRPPAEAPGAFSGTRPRPPEWILRRPREGCYHSVCDGQEARTGRALVVVDGGWTCSAMSLRKRPRLP